jgi:uncharacterized protein YbjT (DUF2867 family)
MATALIAGASGLVGGLLLRELLAAGEHRRVTAVGRRPVEVEHPRLRQVTVDFSALENAGDALQADDVFCCLGTTMRRAGSRAAFRAVDHGAVLALAWAAKRAGLRPGERLAQAALWVAEPLLLGRLRKYRAIEAATVARAMLRVSFARGERGVRVFESDEIEDLGRFAPG